MSDGTACRTSGITQTNSLLVAVPCYLLGVMSLIEHGRRYRLVAIALFIFALADLAYPQSCCDEFLSFFETASVVSITSATAECSGAAGSQRDAQSDPAGTQDDCFCCCTHVMPTPHFDLAAPCVQSPPVDLELTSLPSLSPARIFHPPRIA